MAVTFLSLPATASKVAVSPITTFNGAADAGGAYAELGKIGWGADGTYTDVTPATPLPIYGPDVAVTGTITATDIVGGVPAGAGAFINAASTAGSTVSVLCLGGDSSWNLQITGLTTGAVYFEISLDSTNGADGNWMAVNGRQTGVINTVLSNNASASGLYRGNTSGAKYLRFRQTGTLTGTPAISIRVSDGTGAMFMNASIPGGTNSIGVVTGTFFQATQPVSLASTINVAGTRNNNGTGTVAGSFHLTTGGSDGTNLRPLSVDATGRLNANAILAAETTKVIGTVNVSAAQTIAVTQSTAANLNMTATPIAVTKGTQGATGFTTQDLKDAGRNLVCYYTLIPVLTSATDTLQSLTGTKGGVTVAATTTPAVVTTAKNFRVSSITATYISTAASGYAVVRVRAQPAGVASLTSPVVATFAVGSSAPTTANAVDCVMEDFPDGSEFAAGVGIGISVQGFAAVTATAVGYVMVSINGYEY